MKVKKWPKEVYACKSKWLALSADEKRLVGWGKTPKVALNMAKKDGEEKVIFLMNPRLWWGRLVV